LVIIVYQQLLTVTLLRFKICYSICKDWVFDVDVEETVDPMRNPFKLPSDNEIFQLRDKEKQHKMQVNRYCDGYRHKQTNKQLIG